MHLISNTYESKMIMSSCNKINYITPFIYVTNFLKGSSAIRKIVLRLNEDLKYFLSRNLLI